MRILKMPGFVMGVDINWSLLARNAGRPILLAVGFVMDVGKT